MYEENRLTVIDTAQMTAPTETDDLYHSRENAYSTVLEGEPEVTILVIAYNRLEKTKRCVTSILEHTDGVNYELLLIDNGSEDGTLEYFQSVQHPLKRIIRITKKPGFAIRIKSGPAPVFRPVFCAGDKRCGCDKELACQPASLYGV